MAFSSPLSPALGDEATGLTREEYKIKSLDGTEVSLWRIATRSAAATEDPKPALIYVSSGPGPLFPEAISVGTVNLDILNRALIDKLGPKPLHDAGIVLLSVTHRSGQGSPFSSPVADVYAAYEYALTHGDDLRIQPHNIAMVGLYASGQFVWSATHIAIDLGLPAPCGVMVIDPVFDPKANWETKEGFEPQSFPRFDEQREQIVRRGQKEGWDVVLRRVDFTWFPAIVRKYIGLLQLSREDLSRLPPMFLDVGFHSPPKAEVHKAREMLAKANVEVFGYEYLQMKSEHGLSPIFNRTKNGRREMVEKMRQDQRQFFEKVWQN
ncbi:hypothetical protein AYL99_11968 [Fonsecaea erecta]|uniref:Alpha/beta hydrolase fold-3 domain-containing protein n=1 Tax=Fonsecaea erecta TaxID=1367422 RepID=A0A178Z414_9EURO|nr:hypothetical protein AYL99_11968 [Fonsecaea erecta]OAP53845.1 hypothetical protein AYL99_11968 [Fonsecaea erecta]